MVVNLWFILWNFRLTLSFSFLAFFISSVWVSFNFFRIVVLLFLQIFDCLYWCTFEMLSFVSYWIFNFLVNQSLKFFCLLIFRSHRASFATSAMFVSIFFKLLLLLLTLLLSKHFHYAQIDVNNIMTMFILVIILNRKSISFEACNSVYRNNIQMRLIVNSKSKIIYSSLVYPRNWSDLTRCQYIEVFDNKI